MVTLSGFPTALDQETKVDTSAASEVILQWVRDHKIWVGPVVFLLSFLESFAFVSLIVPATFILLGVGADWRGGRRIPFCLGGRGGRGVRRRLGRVRTGGVARTKIGRHVAYFAQPRPT